MPNTGRVAQVQALALTIQAFVCAGTLELQNNNLTGTVPNSLSTLGRLSKFSCQSLYLEALAISNLLTF